MSDVQRCPYTAVPDAHGRIALRPQLPLTLMYHGQSVEVTGLLDSGADVNVLPYYMGVALGAVWAEQTTEVELSGNLASYQARGLLITVRIGQFTPTLLVFAWTRAEQVPLILGQVNFFLEYDVCFYRARAAFDVQPKRMP